MATVINLFSEYGARFIKTPEGREVFFNRKSFLYNRFDHSLAGDCYEKENLDCG